jgi:hypothetical protein
MEWMQYDVANIEESKAETEAFVLRQRKKSGSVLIEEQLSQIEMYPPLTQQIFDVFNKANHNAGLWECSEDFLAEIDGTPLERFFTGGRVSIRELNDSYLEILSSAFDYQLTHHQSSADNARLVRDEWLKPANRLEAWFVGGEDMIFYQLVANTKFGLYERSGPGWWKPFERDRETQDMVFLAGGSIFHVRPEREDLVIDEVGQKKWQGIRLTPTTHNKYRVHYGDRAVKDSDFDDRAPLNPDAEIKYSKLDRISARVVKDSFFQVQQDFTLLKELNLYIGEAEESFLTLKAFFRGERSLSNYHLKRVLNDCLSENEDGESFARTAAEIRKAKEQRTLLEKLIEKQDYKYFPESSMVLLVSYYPEMRMWLEYRSRPYGLFARYRSHWQAKLTQDNEVHKLMYAYEVKEELVPRFVALIDGLNAGTGKASAGLIAKHLAIIRMQKDADIAAIDPDAWDRSTFNRDQMQASTFSVIEDLYEQVMALIAEFSERLDDDDEVGAGQVSSWMEELEGEAMIDFMNGERSINRQILSLFMDSAPDFLVSIPHEIEEI